MLTSVRMVAALSLVALVATACGSEGAAAVADGGSSSSPLEGCALPRPCSWPIASGKETDGPRCVISELSNGRSVAVETKLVADGGDQACEVREELHFFVESNVAFRVWRKKCDAGEERRTTRCTMLSRDAYVTCLASFDESRADRRPTGIECSLPSDWMTDCAEVEAPVCP